MRDIGCDDRDLLTRIQQGDGDSFGTLYDRTHGWLLCAIIVPRVGRAAAEDVLAETYSVALDKIGSFRWRGTGLLHWLAAIARRKAQEHLRKAGLHDVLLEGYQDLFDLPAGSPTAEAEMIHREHLRAIRAKVQEVLLKLSSRYADALRLRLLESRSRLECARLLGVKVATFDVILHRATRAFAREWERHEQA